MVSRGPSISHVRATSNPFMTTSAGVVGSDILEPIIYDAPEVIEECGRNTAGSPKAELKHYMYQRSSQAIGDFYSHEKRSILSQRMDKPTIQKEIHDKNLIQIRKVKSVQPHELSLSPEPLLPPTTDIKVLSSQRKQHPMYLTSNASIGAEKSEVHVQVERKSRPNDFTASFNGHRYRDFGLNTAISKSRVCDRLDT